MNKSRLKFLSKLSIIILWIVGLVELALALWTVLDHRYKTLGYTVADVGYIDLWILRYLSLCFFVSSFVTLIMCLILLWGLYSAHILIFIATTMMLLIIIGEITISILTFTSKFETRLALMDQLPKLVITYREGNDERAKRALDQIQSTFRCCGADGRLSFQNNVPLSCNMFSIGCITPTMVFLDASMDALAYILLFSSLLKFLIILFFYTFLYVYHRNRSKQTEKGRPSLKDSSTFRYSTSSDSPSQDNLSKKSLLSSAVTNQGVSDKEYIEKRRATSNKYESSLINQQTQNTTRVSTSPVNNKKRTSSYDQYKLRRLSPISERTERSEDDDSEPEHLRVRYYRPRSNSIALPSGKYLYPSVVPSTSPTIKTRRMSPQVDDRDSGVKRSSSESSLDGTNMHRHRPNKPTETNTNTGSKQKNNKPALLDFSKIFITSVSTLGREDNEVKKPLKPRSLSDPSSSNIKIVQKSILKKSNQRSSLLKGALPNYYDQKQISPIYKNITPSSQRTPKTTPRSNIKQSKQDASLV